MPPPEILVSAGEASSDMYGARLALALQERIGAKFFGMGGPRMAAAGVELITNYHDVAIVGITEVLHRIPTVIRVQNKLAREATQRRAQLAILIDSPGTHLGVARRLKNADIPVGYFIGPQVWAWRPGRVRVVKRLVSHMVVIFPFEEKIYRDAGVPVTFVGHPLVDVVKPSMSRDEFAAKYGLDPERLIIAILPGSRRNEIAQNYPTVIQACDLLARDPKWQNELQFVHVAAPGLTPQLFDSFAKPAAAKITRIESGAYDALAAADCAIVASGTATIEAALLGTPMVVVYRVARATAAILRRMIRTPHIAMVNLVAGRGVVPELIQDDFTPAAVAANVRDLIEYSDASEAMRARLAEVRAKLGPGGAIERAADVFARML